jgi:hypothetical protein
MTSTPGKILSLTSSQKIKIAQVYRALEVALKGTAQAYRLLADCKPADFLLMLHFGASGREPPGNARVVERFELHLDR